MTLAREQQIQLENTPYYHCMVRCVRRAFLCGEDSLTGNNYDHRKQWIVDKIKSLAGIFALDVCAYAVMSNHYHVVLHINATQAGQWSDDEVITRWYQLFKGHALVDCYRQGEALSKAEQTVMSELIGRWRQRLMDISWFMRCLNENIARRANKEDGTKGRFWEGRFKSQALLDEAALLTCMMYVDLNPIRAGVCESLEDSDFTSIQERLQAYQSDAPEAEQVRDIPATGDDAQANPPVLLAFAETESETATTIPFALQDYLQLADWAGRAIREDKKGYIPDHIPPILNRLGVQDRTWLDQVQHFGRRFHRVIGPVATLKALSESLGVLWLRGVRSCAGLYRQSQTV